MVEDDSMKRDNKDKDRNALLEKVKYFDQQIESESFKLRQINTAHEYLSRLKESIDKCSEIVSNSLEKGVAKQKFDNLVSEGNLDFAKACGSFEEQADVLRNKVSDLRLKKENTIREYEENTYDE